MNQHKLPPVTPINQKVAYVKRQGQNRNHHCHWPGCQVQVPPAMWGCRRHWFMLPKYLRDKIWRAYEPGQEIEGTPLTNYIQVACEVRDWILKNHSPDTRHENPALPENNDQPSF